MSEHTTEINWPQLISNKASDVMNILNGLSQQDIENVLSIVKNRLPVKLTLVLEKE